MTTVYLVPRGKPEVFTQWADSKPRAILVSAETPTYWEGKPISNPACPTLQYPKFAWEEAELKPTHACHNPNCISRNWPGSASLTIPEMRDTELNCDYCGVPMEVIK